MIPQDSSRQFASTYLQAPMLPQAITSQNGKEPIDLLMGNTGTLVWCERPPTLKDFLAATGNF